MSKKVILNFIPKEAAPVLLLPNIGAIEVLHRNRSKKFIPTNHFLKNQVVAIKFHNPHLVFKRTITPELFTPIVEVKNTKLEVVDRFDSGTLTADEIMAKVEAANQKAGDVSE
jgi:hypothetical protein